MPKNQNIEQVLKKVLIELMHSVDADKISVKDVAQKANISRASFYRYYNSIDDILQSIEDEFIEGMRDCSRYYISTPINIHKLGQPYPSFIQIAEFLSGHKEEFLVLTGFHGDARFVSRFKKLIKEFYCGKIAFEGIITDNVDVYIEFVIAGNISAIRYWLEKKPNMKPEDIAPVIQRMLYGPLVC